MLCFLKRRRDMREDTTTVTVDHIMDLIISALFLEYSVGVFTEEHDITVFYTWGGTSL